MEPITHVPEWTEQQLIPRTVSRLVYFFALLVLAAGVALFVGSPPAGLDSDVFTRKRLVGMFPRLETIGGA